MRRLWLLWKELTEPDGVWPKQVRDFGEIPFPEIKPLDLPEVKPLVAKRAKRKLPRPVLTMKRRA